MSLSSALIQENIAAQRDKLKAMSKIAEDEKRDLTDDEKRDSDEWLNAIGEDGDGKDVIPTGLIADLRRAERFENNVERERLERVAAKAAQTTPSTGPEDGLTEPSSEPDDAIRASKIKIPAKARYRAAGLLAYKGQYAQEHAYIAGQFGLACIFDHEPSQKWCRDHGVSFKAALSGGDNTLGGVLVPEEMERTIIELREQYGVARRECEVVPMGSDTKNQPRLTSGSTATWETDNGTIDPSDPNFDNVRLVAKKLAALILWSSEIAEDEVIGLGDILTRDIAHRFARTEDLALFLGDGTSTYGGIKGLITAVEAGSTVTAATGNIAFSTLDLDDFEAMVGKLPNYADDGDAKWYIHRAAWASSMQRLADAAGGNTTETIAAGASQRLFLGYPVVFSQTMNSTLTDQTSTDGLCYFGNMRQAAMFGDRRGITVATSTERYFEKDQIAIRGTERLDITVHETGDASNAGSITMLSTPSS